jgi:hypothetical protein|tara:strand:+ start:7935 stop:8846 length:912 start_codon:yes stop_codon:yes gene_type:complete
MSDVFPKFVNSRNQDDFLSAVEKILSDGQVESGELMSASRSLANNPRGVGSVRLQLQSFLNAFQEDPTMLSGLLAEEQEKLKGLESTPAPQRKVPKQGGAANVAKGINRSAIARRDKAIAAQKQVIDSLSALGKVLGGDKKQQGQKTAPEKAPTGEEAEEFDLAAAGYPMGDEPAEEAPEFDLEAAGYPMGDEPAEEAPADTAKERMLASIKENTTGEEFDTAFDDALPKGMEDAVPSDVDVPSAAKAGQAEALFKTVHGGPFDPKSRVDKDKLAKIKENLGRAEYQGLTPNQFALKMYREAS